MSAYTILGSGSSGNAILIDGPDPLLLDAGFPAPLLETRLRAAGCEPRRLAGIVLTHDHADHSRGALRLSSEHGVPLYGTPGTLGALRDDEAERPADRRPVNYRAPTSIGSSTVELFPVLHDAAEPAGVRIERAGRTLAYLTDAGRVTPEIVAALKNVQHLLVESNHDPDLLRAGPYPEALKRRIRSGHGHLSNDACADLLAQVLTAQTRQIVLHHLSLMNNTPELAMATVHSILHRRGLSPGKMVAAPPHGPFGPFAL